MFEVARNVRGWTKADLSKKCNLTTKRISQIENGNVEPTQDEVDAIAGQYACDFPLSFFQQWWETRLDFSGCVARNVPINYYKYKVFRDLNPPPLAIVF